MVLVRTQDLACRCQRAACGNNESIRYFLPHLYVCTIQEAVLRKRSIPRTQFPIWKWLETSTRRNILQPPYL